MFLHLSVILFTGRRGCIPACITGHTGRHPPSRHPLGRHPLGRHPPPQADTILVRHHPDGQSADGTHPTGMHSCICRWHHLCVCICRWRLSTWRCLRTWSCTTHAWMRSRRFGRSRLASSCSTCQRKRVGRRSRWGSDPTATTAEGEEGENRFSSNLWYSIIDFLIK